MTIRSSNIVSPISHVWHFINMLFQKRARKKTVCARALHGMRINDYWSIATRSDDHGPGMNICRILFIHNVDGKQIAVSSPRLFVSIWGPCKYTRDIGFSFTCKSNRGASNKGTGFILSMLSSRAHTEYGCGSGKNIAFHTAYCALRPRSIVADARSVIKFSFARNLFATETAGACEYVFTDAENIVEAVWQMVYIL